MPQPSMHCAEVMALRALSELDQLEGDWMACIATRDAVAVSEAVRLLGLHLMRTMRDLQVAMVIGDAEVREAAEGKLTGYLK